MDKIEEFLRHSNYIEGEYDEDSYTQARIAWDWLIKQKKMTPSVVLKTHKLLMLHQNLYDYERGYFRNVAVYIGGHAAMNAIRVPEMIEKWCEEMNWEVPLDRLDHFSQRLHVQYEHIHPFVDGNGRTGRMFMNWWRIKNGLPVLVIHEGEEQMAYYKWFNP